MKRGNYVLFLNKLFRTILIVTISGFSSDTLKGKVGIKKQTHVKNKVVIYDMEQSDKEQLL